MLADLFCVRITFSLGRRGRPAGSTVATSSALRPEEITNTPRKKYTLRSERRLWRTNARSRLSTSLALDDTGPSRGSVAASLKGGPGSGVPKFVDWSPLSDEVDFRVTDQYGTFPKSQPRALLG